MPRRYSRPRAICAARHSGGANLWPAYRLEQQAFIEAPPGLGETLENPSHSKLCYFFCLHYSWDSIPVNRSYSGLGGHSLAGDYNYLSMHRYSKSPQVVENVIHLGIV